MFNPTVTDDNPPVETLRQLLIDGAKLDIHTWLGTGIQRVTIGFTDFFYDDVTSVLGDMCPAPLELVESDVVVLGDNITRMSTIAYARPDQE